MTNKKNLNKRQDDVLKAIATLGQASVSQIAKNLAARASTITLKRDLRMLSADGYIKKHGAGRSTSYSLSPKSTLLQPIDIDEYFKKEIDERSQAVYFNSDIIRRMADIFTPDENQRLAELNRRYRANLKKLSPTQIKREVERLTIELSWKSSRLEGNTYTLLETERLLKQNQAAANRTKEETQMILNHKDALDAIRQNLKRFKQLSSADIEHVHTLLVKNLGIARNIRRRIVRITGTNYRPPDNEHQIREGLEKMCGLINREPAPCAKALLAIVLISYLQPFEDGNKRAGRLIGNALLLAHDYCPLSYRSIDEVEYKKAMILFYEQNNLYHLKRLFTEQFEFAVNNYFGG